MTITLMTITSGRNTISATQIRSHSNYRARLLCKARRKHSRFAIRILFDLLQFDASLPRNFFRATDSDISGFIEIKCQCQMSGTCSSNDYIYITNILLIDKFIFLYLQFIYFQFTYLYRVRKKYGNKFFENYAF